MSAVSPVERIVDAFVAYAVAKIPTLLNQANSGQVIQAPAFKKVAKTAFMESQYFPAVGINLDSVAFDDSGSNSIRVECEVGVIAVATASKPDLLAAYLDRYLDAISDLASSSARAGSSGFEVKLTSADKGLDPDGTNGWVAVSFTVWGEAPF
jgi:hypothetical protein